MGLVSALPLSWLPARGWRLAYLVGRLMTRASRAELESSRSLMFSVIEHRAVGKARSVALMLGEEVDPIYRATLLRTLALRRALRGAWALRGSWFLPLGDDVRGALVPGPRAFRGRRAVPG